MNRNVTSNARSFDKECCDDEIGDNSIKVAPEPLIRTSLVPSNIHTMKGKCVEPNTLVNEVEINYLGTAQPTGALAFEVNTGIRASLRSDTGFRTGNYSGFLDENNLVCQTSVEHLKVRNRILIVDDALLNRKMMRRILECRFNVIDEAENGQQALDMVRASLVQDKEAHYDVITMDYQMPVMDGVTATCHIRRLGYKGLIVAVTGNALGDDIHTFLSSGANTVLTKPLTTSVIYQYLDSVQL